MTKVLHISNYYPPYIGGIQVVAHDIVTALSSNKEYDQHVICFNDAKKTIHENVDGISVIRVGNKLKIASQALNFEYGSYLQNLFKEINPDIIHFHYPNPFVSHYLVEILKKYNYKGKLIVHYHADIIKQKILKQFFVKQTKWLLDRANVILATSPAYLKDTDFLPSYKEKVQVLPLCIGKERTNITETQKKKAADIKNTYCGKNIVFFFGRHVKYKGLTYLIDADKYLDQDKIQIIIAGQGPLTDALKKQSMAFSNIDFVGRLSEDDINSYLMACDIFAFPSITRNEAFGISLAEAMYFGKPACTFTIPGSGVNWVCRNNKEGLEAPNQDSKAFGKNIMALSNNKELYKRLSNGAKERCNQEFLRDTFDRRILNIYQKLFD